MSAAIKITESRLKKAGFEPRDHRAIDPHFVHSELHITFFRDSKDDGGGYWTTVGEEIVILDDMSQVEDVVNLVKKLKPKEL